MDCNETRRLLEADSDGELDLVRHLEIETHLRSCRACASVAAAFQARGTALRTNLPRFTAPAQLAGKLRSAIRAKSHREIEPPSGQRPPSKAKIFSFPLSWLNVTAIAASFAVVLFVGYSVGAARTRGQFVFDEAIASHVRSLQLDHLTDVASTDQHTVKPWFAGKLDFSPPVIDLAAEGYPLTGGRLEHIAHRRAAALVFHRRQHAINLFVWPADATPVVPRHLERDGYGLISFREADLNFLAVSEIAATELDHFVQLYRGQVHASLESAR
jgi:anti-sigma factor RsiW